MKLLDEIIGLLSDKDGSLTDALLKMKVVMFSIGHKELIEWVNDELNGYPREKEVPDYRIIGSRLMGTLRDIAAIYNRYPIPTSHLPKEHQEYFNESKMRQSIAALEGFATNLEGHLTVPVAPEFYRKLGEGFTSGTWVERAWIESQPSQIVEILVTVRSRLLDFALELKNKLGDAEGEAEVKEAAKKFDAPGMFHGAVFGDNTTLIVGDNNKTSIKNEVRKGDFASLAAVLKSNGVAEADVVELQTAIQADGTDIDVVNKKPGSSVKAWMSKMMGKAVDTSWQIELGVAGSLLANAITAYYF